MRFDDIIGRAVEIVAETERRSALTDRLNHTSGDCLDKTEKAVMSTRGAIAQSDEVLRKFKGTLHDRE